MPRQPFRSPVLGYILMLLGGVGLASILVVDWRPGNRAPDDRWLYFIFGCLFLGPVSIAIGAKLIRRDAASVLADDTNRPIVYLRPFSDEDLLSPGNAPWREFTERWKMLPMNVVFFAIIVGAGGGIIGFAISSIGGILESIGHYMSLTCMSVVYVLIVYAPFYAYRMMRGRINVTLEQELSRQLRGIGPFVAIGEPGEMFAPEGAARVYLDDESWQKTVKDMIDRAGIVVVHLVDDGWTWWEFEQVMKNSDPRRVIGVLGGGWLNEASYKKLRQRARQELSITLPDAVSSFEFVTFDSDGTSRVMPVRRKWRAVWPLTSFHLHRSTLAPFINRLPEIEA